jgi:uncharacterized protein
VYEGADQSWRGRPRAISDETVSQTAERIAEHARLHELPAVQVVLHGGEPLLAGPARLRKIATGLRSALPEECHLDLRVHTNGVLLNEEFCQVFDEQGIRVGISLDGDQSANDRHRRYADGRSSYDQVIRAVGLLRTVRFRHLYGGLLCTIDVANDPVVVYESLLSLQPPQVDFLLPHATWDNPPVRDPATESQYADWLIAIFERWMAGGQPIRIRTFASIVSTLTGGESLTEALGLAPARLVVIETDGRYEQVDSLKTAFDGAPATGLDVFSHTLDAVGEHPGIAARQQGRAGLCATCQKCPVVTSCGGGLYAHRYRSANGFANPSVYCSDLLKLITHVESRLETITTRPAPANHALDDGDFRELAGGLGGARAMEQLIAAQRTLGRALLAAVYQAGSTTPAVPARARAALRAAWPVLAAAEQEGPDGLNAVLSHPYLRVWAVRCLEQLRQLSGSAAADQDGGRNVRGLAADLAYLGAVAAASAIRARADAVIAVPVMGAAVHLPTLGRLALTPSGGAEGDRCEEAVLTVDGDKVSVRTGSSAWVMTTADLLGGDPWEATTTGDGRTADWQPVRVLRAPGICVALEDTDPYRDCHQWSAAPRLTNAEFGEWQRRFQDAWQEIKDEHSAYAPAIAAALGVLMPMSTAPQGREISATARHAFGAIGSALPDDPATLALLIIHEFQHVKLGAVLDLYDLYDPADSRLFHVPWRDDLRPLEGLLQGTYAHVAVTDFWRARQEKAGGAAAESAGQRYAFWHAHTRDAVETLAGSGSLTPLGVRFVDEMRKSARI